MAIKKKPARQAPKRTPSPNKGKAKRTPSSKKVTPIREKKSPRRSRPSGAPKVTVKTLDALSEWLDMMLPEVMFRIAAMEHVLVKNQLCSYDELVNARQFIQEQESS
jgi:hypothetical protein